MKKRILALLVAALMVVGMMPTMAFAADPANVEFEAPAVEVKADESKTFTVAINLTSNPGFAAGSCTAEFDSDIMTLTGIATSAAMAGMTGIPNVATGSIGWFGVADTTATGEALRFTFELKDGVLDTTYDVKFTFADMVNAAYTTFYTVDAVTAKVTVKGSVDASEYTPVFSVNPADADYVYGDSIEKLTVTAALPDGTTDGITYQWYSAAEDDFSKATAIEDATSAEYTPVMGDFETTTYYWCQAAYEFQKVSLNKVSESAAISYNKAPLTVTGDWQESTFVYDGTMKTVSVVLSSDLVKVVDFTGDANATNVGEYTVDGVEIAPKNDDVAANYIITNNVASHTWTITPAVIEVAADPALVLTTGRTSTIAATVVNATTVDGSAATVTYTVPAQYASIISVSGDQVTALKAGTAEINYTVTAANHTEKSGTIAVTVNDKLPVNVEITSEPDKMTGYVEGDTLDTTGLTVTITYDDSSVDTDVTSGFTVSPTVLEANPDAVIVVTVTVVEGVSDTFELPVGAVKAKLTADDFTATVTDKVYDGTPAAAVVVTPKVSGVGDATVLYNGEAAVPTDAGTYVITVKFAEGANYAAAEFELADTLVIEKAPVTITTSAATVTVKKGAVVDFTATASNGAELTFTMAGTNASYADGKISGLEIGTDSLTVSYAGDKNYAAAESVVVTINVVDLDPQVFDESFKTAETKTFGDAAFTKAATLTTGTGAITYASSNTAVATVNATTGEVTIVGIGTTVITATAARVEGEFAETSIDYTLTVNPKPITVTIAPIADQEYTGAAIKPAVTVNADVDVTGLYDVAYANNTNVGTATVTVTSKAGANYTFSATAEFQIIPQTTEATATLAYTKVTYTGSAFEPAVTVKAADGKVIPAAEYTVAYSNNTNAGTATVTVTDKTGGNYTFDAVTVNFTIEKATLDIAANVPAVDKDGVTLGEIGEIMAAGMGTIEWADGADTVIEPNVEYAFKFIPNDTANYNVVEGSVMPFANTPVVLPEGLAIHVKNDKPAEGVISTTPNVAKSGAVVTVIAKPAAGYELASVSVVDKLGNKIAVYPAGENRVSFVMPNSSVTVSAAFVKATGTVKMAFVDVKTGDWYYSAVEYAFTNGLMNGTTATTFEPNAKLTRGMLMTVLARLAGADTAGGATWYTKGMEWAKAAGISDGTNPTKNITRQEAVTMLYRYAGVKADEKTVLGQFPDSSLVATWAEDAMNWAVSVGLIKGDNAGNLNPQGTATRAEIATMLMRFIENVQ